MNRVAEALDIVKRAKALGDCDSNVIGMAAEVIAEDIFGMVKAPTGTKNIDGHIIQNGIKASVQVKAFSSGRVLRYRGGTFFRIPENGSEKLIILLIYSHLAKYEILYNGNANNAGRKENNRPNRIVRLDSLKKQDELDAIIQKCDSSDPTHTPPLDAKEKYYD